MLMGQFFCNNRPAFLLDAYPNAGVAFSTSKLRGGYTGNCMKVRRSSDSAEMDFGFKGDVLDTTALLAFVGSGHGQVVTWYDQSGNGRNATQSTGSLQPYIAISGAVTMSNSYPAIKIFAFNQLATAYTINKPYSFFFACQQEGESNYRLIHSVDRSSFISPVRADHTAVRLAYVVQADEFAAAYENVLVSLLVGNATLSIFKNAGAVTLVDNTAVDYGPLAFGEASYNEPGGFLTEFISYPSDKAADRAGIENFINEHYKIY